jgi:hypothetical protein
MKKNDIIFDPEFDNPGIIVDCDDLHNVKAKFPYGGIGLYCLDPNCDDNNIDEVEIYKSDEELVKIAKERKINLSLPHVQSPEEEINMLFKEYNKLRDVLQVIVDTYNKSGKIDSDAIINAKKILKGSL